MVLSILIASLDERADQYDYIFKRINHLIDSGGFRDKVEVVSYIDNREISSGEKKNILKGRAKGLYICYLDDDDDVTDDYLTEIMKAIEVSGSDVITFDLHKFTDGVFEYRNIYSKFMKQGLVGGILVMRPPQLCPHKKILADQISFPHNSFMQDAKYMADLDKITKTECHINKVLYIYKYRSGKYKSIITDDLHKRR